MSLNIKETFIKNFVSDGEINCIAREASSAFDLVRSGDGAGAEFSAGLTSR